MSRKRTNLTIYDNLFFDSYWCVVKKSSGWWRAKWLLCLLFSAWLGPFSVLHGAASAETLPAQNGGSSINLERYASLLLDPTGVLTIEEIASEQNAARFLPLRKPISLGFTRSVAWVKIDLTSRESSQWLLEVGQPIFEDVRLYQRTSEGEMRLSHGTPSRLDSVRETHYRRPVFKIDLVADEPTVIYLRLATRTSMVTNLKLWSPMALFEESNLETFIWGLVFGSYLLVVIFYSAFSVWTREDVHFYYVLYVCTNLVAAFLTGRWNDMLALHIDTNTHTLALGFFLCLSLWIGPVFSVSYLGAHRHWPMAAHIYLGSCTSVAILCIGMVLMGHYSQGVMTVQIASIFVILINTAVSGYMAYKGDKKGQLLLLAFSLFYIGVMWRYLRNIGVIEPSWWNENVYQIGAFVHMMVMSTGIFSSYNTLRRKSEQDRARADAQEKQRDRQYEFLGMVSHEVRTPLTVISASADNLLLDASLTINAKNRVERIIRHSEKLQKLFDTYLDNERLLNGGNTIKMFDVNLSTLCESLVKDMKDAHDTDIRFVTTFQLHVQCDGDLLRVAISNLLENARKHAPEKSSTTLSLSRAGDLAQISVTDQGPGIDDQDMPFIFDAYFRGQGIYTSPGSGLGLHLVRFIAEQHRGKIYAKKLKSRGMQFVLEIPIRQAHLSI